MRAVRNRGARKESLTPKICDHLPLCSGARPTMRIRKHTSKVLNAASSPSSVPPAPLSPRPSSWIVPSVEQPEAVLVCKLNQSPWDVVTYPPTPPRQDLEVRPPNAKAMGAMEWDGSDAKKGKKKVSMEDNDKGGSRAAAAKSTAICRKTDGKKWKCKQPAAHTGSFCHYHLAQLQSYSNTVNTKASATSRKRNAKVALPAALARSDSNDFYYYSVFGPWRGKKRGSGNNKASASEVKQKDEKVESGDIVEDEIAVEFDIVDDSTDEEDKGKKRKPVKSRSLKSLL